MAAPLHDPPVFQHHDGVGIADGGQPVGNDKHRPPLHQLIHALLDQGLGTGVDGGSGLIQDQHRRVGHRRPGNGQQLPLALGQVGAVCRHHSLISLGQAADKGIGIGNFHRLLHLLHGGVQFTKANVIGNGAGKEVGVLKHHAQGSPQIVFPDVFHVNPVVDHPPLLHVVEAVDQIGNGGLSCAGGPHEGNFLTRFGKEAYILQNGVAGVIAKGDILEANVPTQGHRRAVRLAPNPASVPLLHSHLTLIHLRRLVHSLKNPFGTCQGSQHKITLLGELVDGQGCLPHKNQIAGQAAHIGHAPHGHIAPQCSHNGIIKIGNAYHRRDHGGGITLRAGARFAQGLVLLPETAQILLFMVEYLD